MWVYDRTAKYSVRLRYIPPARNQVNVDIYNGAEYVPIVEIAPTPSGKGREATKELPRLSLRPEKDEGAREVSGRPGSNELVIRRVVLVDESGREKAVFRAEDRLILKMSFSATKAGRYPVTLCAVLHRIDGIRVSCHLSDEMVVEMSANETREVELDFGKVNLGNGNYVFAAALYKYIDPELRYEPQIYDLHDRNYEFQVIGRSATDGAIFHHTAAWGPITSKSHSV